VGGFAQPNICASQALSVGVLQSLHFQKVQLGQKKDVNGMLATEANRQPKVVQVPGAGCYVYDLCPVLGAAVGGWGGLNHPVV
jgi:hypothetical protein